MVFKKLFKMKAIKTIGAFFGIVANISFAMNSDANLPTLLSSDSAVCKRQNNVSVCIYSGNARMVQGTTNLQAQQITIHKKPEGKVNKIVASGKLSNYSTVLDNNKLVNADADLITIYPDKKLMVLQGDGRMVVGQDKYSGPDIKYNFK